MNQYFLHKSKTTEKELQVPLCLPLCWRPAVRFHELELCKVWVNDRHRTAAQADANSRPRPFPTQAAVCVLRQRGELQRQRSRPDEGDVLDGAAGLGEAWSGRLLCACDVVRPAAATRWGQFTLWRFRLITSFLFFQVAPTTGCFTVIL